MPPRVAVQEPELLDVETEAALASLEEKLSGQLLEKAGKLSEALETEKAERSAADEETQAALDTKLTELDETIAGQLTTKVGELSEALETEKAERTAADEEARAELGDKLDASVKELTEVIEAESAARDQDVGEVWRGLKEQETSLTGLLES